MQINKEGKIESKAIDKQIKRELKLTPEEKAAEEKKKAAEKLLHKTDFKSTNSGWRRIFSFYKPQWVIALMMLTAIINSFSMPVIALMVIKLQFTYYSKFEGNAEWESEAHLWIIIMFSWIFVLILMRAIEKSLFSVMGEKMTL